MDCATVNNGYIQLLNAFDKIEQNIASLLVQNKNLFKVLKYTSWEINPYLQPIDDDTIDCMITQYDSKHQLNPHCRVFFEPFIPATISQETAQIRIYPVQINPIDIYEAELYMQADVIVDLKINKFKGGRRIFAATSELYKSLNGKEIGMLKTLEFINKPLALRQFKDDFWGFSYNLRTGVGANGLC